MSEDAYKWVAAAVGSERYALVLNIRGCADKILKDSILKHYTMHDIEHSDRIVQIIGKLIDVNPPVPVEKLLSKDEILILVLAAALHDIGMQLPRAHRIEKHVNELMDEDLESIRARHGEVSALVIRQGISTKKDIYGTGILHPDLSPYMPYVAELCELHQSSKDYDPNGVSQFSSDYDSHDKIRMGMITGLLRLADELDCDRRRVNIDRLEQFSIPPKSKVHWYGCHYVDSVHVNNGRIELHAAWHSSVSSAEASHLGQCIISRIQKELALCKDVLWDNGVKLDLNSRVIVKKATHSLGKKPIPPDIIDAIRDAMNGEPSANVRADPSLIGETLSDGGPADWMAYWGMIGNPFIDLPLAYGSANLVDTDQFRKIAKEIGSYLKGSKGELRLVVARRGQGKTTLFQYLEGMYGESVRVSLVDVGDRVASIRNAAELNNLILGKILEDINPESEGYDSEELLDWSRKKKKSLICVDSIDRLDDEKDDIVRKFFTAAQHILTTLKQNHVLLLSCSDRWLNMIQSEELSYLGAKNQWVLEPFSTKDTRSLLDKRLKSANLSYDRIFGEECLGVIHTMSEGNPRKVLQLAESLCRYAAGKNVRKINFEFIKDNFQREYEGIFKALIDGLYGSSKNNSLALTALYKYTLETERRSLNSTEGWEYLVRMMESELLKEDVHPSYHVPLGAVADIYQSIGVDGTQSKPSFRPKASIRSLFTELKKKEGYTPRDFVVFYSAASYLPESDEDEILRIAKSPLLVGEDIPLFDDARAQYDYVLSAYGKRTSSHLITKAWDAAQSMLAAILIKRNVLSASRYSMMQDELYVENWNQIRRYRKGVGMIMASQAKEMKEMFMNDVVKKERLWFDSLHSLLWIMNTRNNIIRGRTDHAMKYGEKEYLLCISHLKLVFSELLRIYG